MSATKTKKPAAKSPKAAKARSAKAKPPKAEAPAKATKSKAEGKLSALDAAAQVLAASGEPMTCQALIEAMAEKGLWSSPNGKTPERTLYSALAREINEKGADARFVKSERGKFAARK
jgi:hypothetical protein